MVLWTIYLPDAFSAITFGWYFYTKAFVGVQEEGRGGGKIHTRNKHHNLEPRWDRLMSYVEQPAFLSSADSGRLRQSCALNTGNQYPAS